MARRYEGIRPIKTKKGNTYEISYRVNGRRFQYRIIASSDKEASLIRAQEIARKIEAGQQLHNGNYSDISLERAYELLMDDVMADKRDKKTEHHYRRTFHRMYRELVEREFSHMSNVNQTTIPFIKRYKNYYVITLGNKNGWRAELTFVKAMITRFYGLGLCRKDIVDSLDLLEKPDRNKKDYKNYPDSKIKELLMKIKKERIDYFRILYYIARTGRRIEESTLIERTDIEWKGIRPVKLNIRIKTTKQDKKMSLEKIDDELASIILEAYKEGKNYKAPYLFLNSRNNKCTQGRVRDYLKEVSLEVLGEEITPHYFRHRFLTRCAINKVPIKDAMAMAGITDIKVVLEHYSHTTEEGLKEALRSSSL